MTATTELLENAEGNFVDTDIIEVVGDPGSNTDHPATPTHDHSESDRDQFCESLVRVAASALDAPVAYVEIASSGSDILAAVVDREGSRPSTSDQIIGLVSRAEQEIRTEDGDVVATLCVADRRERTWVDEDFAQLAELTELLVPQLDRRAHVAEAAPAHSIVDEISVLADSVSPLVDLAELQDHPTLQRYAAASRRRLASVLETAASLAGTRPTETAGLDLRHAVNRGLREAMFVSGRENLFADLGAHTLPVLGDRFAVERAVTHLVGAVLNHTGYGNTRVTLENDAESAFLTVSSEDCLIATAEMARIAASFDEATEGRGGASSIRLVGGETLLSSPAVNANSGRSGSTFVIRWALARG